MSLLDRYRNPHPSSLTLAKFDHETCRISPIRKLFNSNSSPIFTSIKLSNIESNEKENRIKNKSFPRLSKNNRNELKISNDSSQFNYNLEEHKNPDYDDIDSLIDDIDVPFAYQKKSNKNHSNIELKKLPPLPYVSNRYFSDALKEKCKLCETMCDFLDPEADLTAKEIKFQALTDIFDTIASNFSKLSKSDFQNVLSMIEKHIFRPQNEIDPKFTFSDGLVLFVDPSWPHLSTIYQILLSLLTTLPSMFDIEFIKQIINRFNVPFINEQNQLSSVVIQFIYSNPEKVYIILKLISDLFIEYLDNAIEPYAILPALTVFYVINEQYPDLSLKIYFSHFLPLIRSPHYVYFQEVFSQIMSNIFKDKINQKLAFPTIKYIINHWPKTRSSKQVNFFSILTITLANLEPIEFKKIMIPAFHLIAASSCSENQKIAAAAYSIWTPIEIELMIMDNSRAIFPIIYKPVSEALKDHWSTSVHEILQSIIRTMERIDPYVFHEIDKMFNPVTPNHFGQNHNQKTRHSNLHGYLPKQTPGNYYGVNDINSNFLNAESSKNSFYHSNNINNLFSSNNMNSYAYLNGPNSDIEYNTGPSSQNSYSNIVNPLSSQVNKRSVKKSSSIGNQVLYKGYQQNSEAAPESDNSYYRNNWRSLTGSNNNNNMINKPPSILNNINVNNNINNNMGQVKKRPANIIVSNSSLNKRVMNLVPFDMGSDEDNETIRNWAAVIKMASANDPEIDVTQKLREIQKEFTPSKKIRFSNSLTTIRNIKDAYSEP